MLSQIGKYQIEAIIGKGGFGQVYRALDPTIPRHVAIKVVTALEDRSMLARFRVEAGTTGSLQHKNIVTLYDFGEFEGTPFLVMELLEGESLFQSLQRGHRYSLFKSVDIMSQVAEGLRCAHRRGIIHRDIKPANVMLLPDGTAKIMDFGISLLTTRNITRQTQVGFMVGTLAYMAPELLQGRSDANIQTDIFAFGVLFYEIMTGVHPYSTGDQVTTMYRLVHAEPTPVTELVHECPPILETILQRALAKIPEFRYQSLDDVLVDLKPMLDELKKTEASELLAAANTHLTEGNLERAQILVRESLELHPGNAEARQLREKLQERARESAVRARLRQLIEQGDAKLSGGSYADALQLYEAAYQLSQSSQTIKLHLDDARLITEARKRIAQLLVEAAAKLNQGRLEEALERAKVAAASDPENEAARRLVADVQARLQSRAAEARKEGVYRRAEELCSLGQFDQALAELNRIEPESGDSARFSEVKRRVLLERAEAEHQKAVRQLQMAREKINATMQEGKLSEAALLLEVATKRFAGDPEGWPVMVELKGRLDSLRINDLRQQVRGALDSRDWLACEELLSRAEREFPGQEEWGGARQQLRLGRRHEQLEHLEALVRPVLDANDLGTARRYLEASRDALAVEEVWKKLHDEIERKAEYNRDLAQAELLISRGDLDGAESLLRRLTAGTAQDERAASQLEWIAREREARRLAEEQQRAADRLREEQRRQEEARQAEEARRRKEEKRRAEEEQQREKERLREEERRREDARKREEKAARRREEELHKRQLAMEAAVRRRDAERQREEAEKAAMAPVCTEDLPTVEMTIPPLALARPARHYSLFRQPWMISAISVAVVLGGSALAVRTLRTAHPAALKSTSALPAVPPQAPVKQVADAGAKPASTASPASQQKLPPPPAPRAGAQLPPRPLQQGAGVEEIRQSAAAAKPAPERQPAKNAAAPTPAASKPAAPELPREAYDGPSSGVVRWNGNLAESAALRFSNNTPDSGGVAGLRLPGNIAVVLEVVSPPGMTILEQPSAANDWKGFVLRNDSGGRVSSIQLRWRIR
jgi:eukaryotic-like serine/threonine-protein kinase